MKFILCFSKSSNSILSNIVEGLNHWLEYRMTSPLPSSHWTVQVRLQTGIISSTSTLFFMEQYLMPLYGIKTGEASYMPSLNTENYRHMHKGIRNNESHVSRFHPNLEDRSNWPQLIRNTMPSSSPLSVMLLNATKQRSKRGNNVEHKLFHS
jgi:hypothetical protein